MCGGARHTATHRLAHEKVAQALHQAADGPPIVRTHGDRDVHERVRAPRLVRLRWFALDHVDQLALKQRANLVLLAARRPRKRRLERVQEQAAELLHVVLLQRLARPPVEAGRQLLGACRCPRTQLHACEELLQLVRDALLLGDPARAGGGVAPAIHQRSELGQHEECLQQAAQVARRPLVDQARVAFGTNQPSRI